MSDERLARYDRTGGRTVLPKEKEMDGPREKALARTSRLSRKTVSSLSAKEKADGQLVSAASFLKQRHHTHGRKRSDTIFAPCSCSSRVDA